MTDKGRFKPNDDDCAFVLTDPETPRPWQLYLFSETMLVQLNQFGLGMSRYWNEKGEDVNHFDEPERTMIVRNPDGTFWSPAFYPGNVSPENYRCTYHPAHWTASGHHSGCEVSWRISVPVETPVEMWTVTVENQADAPMERDLFAYLPVNLMGFCINKYRFYQATTMFTRAFQQPDVNAIWVKSGIPELPHDRFNAFLACDTAPTSTDTARDVFLGSADNVFAAHAVTNGKCSDSIGYFGEMCLAMHHHVALGAGETKTLCFLTGTTTGPDETKALCDTLLSIEAINAETERAAQARRRDRGAAWILSDNEKLDPLANVWGKCQNRLGVLHRKGFRDVLQDSTGMAIYNPSRAREGISEVVSVQRPDGAGIRAWKPYVDAEEYSDGPYWMPLAVGAYLRETGDFDFLDKPLPYLETKTAEPVWDHLLKGVRYLYEDRNERGLCRIRFADWNDGLDGVGREGKGDSTMVTFGLGAAIRELQALAGATGRTLPFDAEAWIRDLFGSLERHAWTGEYYIRGYRDDGQPFGSPENEYGQIYLNAQGWAVLSGIVPRERWDSILQIAIDRLSTPRGLRLFEPCYPEFDHYLGRVSAELPGVYENGAMYNHGACFFVHALMTAGRIDDAWRFVEMMLPDSPANPSDRSGAEPFVLTNCIFGEEAERRAGTSYFGWYTGSAAWILRAIHNGFSGLRPEFDGLHVDPEAIPAAIGLREVHREYRETTYRLRLDAAQTEPILVDGEPTPIEAPLPQSPGGTVKASLRK